MFKKLGVALALVLLAGCATMNKNECRNAGWNLIGYEDASRGHAMDRIGQHRKACAKVDVVPDISAYEAGHQKGARQYCTADRGYREGVNGANYQGICPADLAPAFMRAYRDGQGLYAIKQRINSTASLLTSYRDQIERHSADIAAHEKSIVDAASSSVSRREHLNAIKDLQQDIIDLEVSSQAANQELIMLENDYQALLQQHQEWGY